MESVEKGTTLLCQQSSARTFWLKVRSLAKTSLLSGFATEKAFTGESRQRVCLTKWKVETWRCPADLKHELTSRTESFIFESRRSALGRSSIRSTFDQGGPTAGSLLRELRTTLLLLPQKKRPLKRAGVKPNGARLYKRFLAGGTAKVGIHPIKDKRKFRGTDTSLFLVKAKKEAADGSPRLLQL
jgi:hypothetical protein